MASKAQKPVPVGRNSGVTGKAIPPLGRSQQERAFLAFEQALICSAEAFYRFAASLLGDIGRTYNLSGQDHVILQQLMFSSSPRGVGDLSRFANRDDIANIQYSLRKLVAAGLVEKVSGIANRDTAYRPTTTAAALTEDIVAARQELLIRTAEQMRGIEEHLVDATNALSLLTGLYDHAGRVLVGRDLASGRSGVVKGNNNSK